MAYNGFVVVDDTFHFDYLMPLCSALLLFVEQVDEVVVLVQCYLDCSMIDEPLETPVVAVAAVAFVDTIPLNLDCGLADTVLRCYFDGGSVNTERYFVGNEVVNYFDAVTDKGSAIHLVDKVSVRCVEGTVVPNNWHSCCTLGAGLDHNSSRDYVWA